MGIRFGTWASLAACGVFLGSTVVAQEGGTISLQEQLKAQYKIVKFAVDGTGVKVIDPGTVLEVKKGGLLAVPPLGAPMCPAKFQDNELKPPVGLCAAMVKQSSRYLQVGEKVYPLKIEVNLEKDRVSFQVVECDSCNGVQQPSYYRSEVVFQFGKGSLHGMQVPQVEDSISQVLAISGDSQDNQQGDQGQNNQGQGQNNQGQNNQGQNNQQGNNNSNNGGQQQEPQQINIGQTIDQVKAALGNPDKIVNLGAKQIFVYKDLKVTFMNGKVSDVQ